jgi:hypothetical protein
MTKNNPKLDKIAMKIDWSAFSYAMVVLFISLLASGGFIFISYEYTRELYDWKIRQEQVLADAERKYREIEESAAVLTPEDFNQFNYLVTRGFFKMAQEVTLEEVTLEEVLLETTEQIKTVLDTLLPQFKIPTVKWKFANQQTPYELPMIQNAVQIYQMPLTLELGILHEADVLNLLQAIESQKNIGLFNIENCEIKRLSDNLVVTKVDKPYFEAICVLNWFMAKIEE